MASKNEAWKDCADWLIRCEVLRPDHKANWPDAKIEDLAYTLRDGVLLCNLLNIVDPSSIDMKDVNQKPQLARFLCLRNIRTFLQTCQDAFGLKESDLFEPSMLFDLSDFYRVLNTLSKLSNSTKLQRKNIQGFSVHKNRSVSQEDIYKKLNSNNAVISPNQNINWETIDRSWIEFTIKCPWSENHDEEVYEDLCYVTFSSSPENQEIKREAYPSFLSLPGKVPLSLHDNDEPSRELSEEVEYGSYYSRIRNEEIYQDLCSINRQPQQQTHSSVSHSLEKRDYVIKELVETERNYVDVLMTVQKCFMRPLNNLLREEDAKIIFSGMRELAEIHQRFLRHLHKAVAPGSTERLSEVFLNWREKFLIYGDYCANLTKAQTLIQDVCARNELVNQEVIRCQQEANNGKFKLRDILSVPMQRILKYHLLLDKLISETQPNHEDYRGLERAKEAMVDVAQFINEVKRDSDMLQLMRDIQASISDWNISDNTDLKNYGRLLNDDELRIRAHDDQKVRMRYVFIFDQAMILCKSIRGESMYSYRESLNLAEYKVEDPCTRGVLRSNARWSYQWFLITKSQRTAYTMYARTEDLKRKWIKAIQEALDNIEPNGCRHTDHKFVMHTFEKPTTCNHCSKFLKGLIFQGYRCEKCDISIHKMCIPNSGRCGVREPPELPPRPIVPSPSPCQEQNGESSPWMDHRHLSEYLWFVGEMGRDRASHLLERRVNGTYLLRIRPQGPTHANETAYALSLKTDDKVKHMKVYGKQMDGTMHYYLSESRFFKSIVELINCYEQSSLGENFVGLDETLKLPYRQVVAIAEFDFVPKDPSHLQLRKGSHVLILGKERDANGWWKGKVQDKIGFFPKNYVRELSDSFNFMNLDS